MEARSLVKSTPHHVLNLTGPDPSDVDKVNEKAILVDQITDPGRTAYQEARRHAGSERPERSLSAAAWASGHPGRSASKQSQIFLPTGESSCHVSIGNHILVYGS